MSMTTAHDVYLSNILDIMADKDLGSHTVRSKNYTKIINSFHNRLLVLKTELAEQMLDVCMADLTNDIQYSSSAIIVISQILKKIKENKCECSSEKLVESAVTLVTTTRKLLIKPLLRKSSIDTLLSYPDKILIQLVNDHCGDVLCLINYDSKTYFDSEITELICQIIAKLLDILPSGKKLLFVRRGVDVWFNTIIPSIMYFSTKQDPLMVNCIGTLETLTDCLKQIDYSKNSKWEEVLQKICDSNKYPSILKDLLQCNPHGFWHTLWKIFIKLLKDQITNTKVNSSGVSPINALLPVVEQAFKMDYKCRCLAFECWNVLIDNFSTELNEALINKRLKLLMTPLKLNNAKVEETVLAKLNTWWHLIRQYHSKMDKFTDTVLIPFLNFCFGKPDLPKTVGGKIFVIPGQMTMVLSMKCIEVLVETIGHVDCNGCTTLASANGRLINTKLMVEHWDLWMFCLQSAMKTAAAYYIDGVKKHIGCLWKGLILIIGELPDNQIRADLFSELLDGVYSLLLHKQSGDKMDDIMLDVLIPSLLADNPKIRPLLKSKNGAGPIYTIIRIIQDSTMNNYFARSEESLDDKVNKLKPISELFLNDLLVDCGTLQCIQAGNRHELWAAFADTFCDSKFDVKNNAQVFNNLVLWPVKTMSSKDQEYSHELWYKWYKFYGYVCQLMNTNALHREILSVLSGKNAVQASNIHFKLCASMALLKRILLTEKKFDAEAQLLLDALSEANDVDSMIEYLPILTDTLHLLLNNISTTVPSARITVETSKIALMIVQATLKHVNEILKKLQYAKKPIFIDNLLESCRNYLNEVSNSDTSASLKSELANAYKLQVEVEHTVASKSSNIIPKSAKNQDPIDNTSNEIKNQTEQITDSNKKDFTTQEPKSVKKTKTNKKEPNIVNTVVENGEEFVVVKSNWKFNPKKLTENQKEKFKRKREDIPALYQDLSQSQDEFKLKSWKADSQDATTSRSESNSKSNDDVAVLLQKLPSTEFVPKIVENIFNNSCNKIDEKSTENVVTDNNNRLQITPTAKGPKTPRLALKDRVFRNVRNLIEKSELQSESTIINQVTEDLNQTVNENNFKTPISKSKTVQNLVNSAPPNILSERPTRCIKKPKKFENTEMYALKKRRRSQSVDVVQEPNEPVTIIEDAENKPQEDNLNKGAIDHQKESQNAEVVKPTTVPVTISAHTENSVIPDNILEENISSNQAKPDNKKMEVDETPIQTVLIQDQPISTNNEDSSQFIEEISTPKPDKTKQKDEAQSATKKKRSRIEKQLLIDMVEGHPVLQQPPPDEKRVTRKNVTNTSTDTVSKRKKSLIEKSNKIKAELVNAGIIEVSPKDNKQGTKTPSSKSSSNQEQHITQNATAVDQEAEKLSQSVTVLDSQSQPSSESQDFPMSEDVIESSQDSTLTTISVKSATKKKVAIVCLDKANLLYKATDTQNLVDDFRNDVISLSDTLNDTCNQEEKEDIELPQNKTMPEEDMELSKNKTMPEEDMELSKNKTMPEEDMELSKNKTIPQENVEGDLTENMDTEPMDSSGEVIILNDEVATPIVINTEDTAIGKETQEIAEADTLPVDIDSQSIPSLLDKDAAKKPTSEVKPSQSDNDITRVPSQEDPITPTLSGTSEVITDVIVESSNTGSPLKDEVQRKKEFLNDTIEISPIKTLSPEREKKSPSPETSSDYVVIKLTSPVQSNGEPFNDKCDSPEIFTEDKISPEKRDQSPPRKEIVTNSSSPSSSLSLKKNRPQMRFNGRAAQMLGLCVPENLQILNTDRSDIEESRKGSPLSTPARRNLKKFYSGENNENQVNEIKGDESDNFLKFTRPLPTAESSPCNPILKRKLADIADDTTVSPASKRKRVSFHDPPVSTTVAVQKYIEPSGVRSPSNSTMKRQERQLRSLTNAKSPKRLDNVFRLETVLTKAVESFTDENTISNDTEMSLDETPAAEIVKTSDLNDTDPICPDLLDCKDPIKNIAGELSSPSTKALLIKELEGKVETIADLAKMTELEVNRLCIKAPKVKIAKKVLSKYATQKAKLQEMTPVEQAPVEIMPVPTQVETNDTEIQTDEVLTKSSEMQTTEVPTAHCSSQTIESGSKSTKDIVSMCLNERPDFVDQLSLQLDQPSVRHISKQLPFDACLGLLLDKMTASNSAEVLNQVITHTTYYSKEESKGVDLKMLQEHLCKRYDTKDLILFCSQLLQKIHDKSS